MFKYLKLFIIFIFIFSITNLVFYYYHINSSSNQNNAEIQFTVLSGQSVKQIGQTLLDAKLIKSKFYFEIYVWQNNLESKLQAGDYILSQQMPIKKIVEILITGKTLNKEKIITIIEGWNARDIGAYLEKENIISKKEFIDKVEAETVPPQFALSDKANWGGTVSANLEGYLFPDTYRIFQNASTEDIINKMLSNFDKKLTQEMRDDITKQGKTIYEIIIMASIVEKEVKTEKDMKIVSGIFWNRIKNGQALESCATLAYILGINKPQYTLEDTKIDSQYNTYKNTGLPPGPISNPGLMAIKASIYPEYTEYNYFLSRSDTGETIFSKSFDEHVMNKQRYLK
ncbi:MAG: endolytic transglycosylase MltG [Patescibacteria group bacterium]